jgi:pimeloyl-ACP methyl ester carboxylesterase
VAEHALVDRSGWPIRHQLLPDSHDRNKAVELFWTKPDGDGSFPAVLFIHGHQEGPRYGGKAYVLTGYLGDRGARLRCCSRLPAWLWQFRRSAGTIADPSRSRPWWSQSTFCGNSRSSGRTRWHSSVIAAAPLLQPWSQLRIRDWRLRRWAGRVYFFNWHPTLPGISRSLYAEAGTSADAFMARSAMYHAEQIKAPVLLLHGAADERIPVQQAEAFAAKLKEAGLRYRIKIYPGIPHSIPIDDQYREVYPFLDEFLR